MRFSKICGGVGLLLLAGCANLSEAPSPVSQPPARTQASIPPVICPSPLEPEPEHPATTLPGTEPRGELVAAQFDQLPDWDQAITETGWAAFLQSCTVLGNQPPWTEVCSAAAQMAQSKPEQIKRFFETRFDPWEVLNPDHSNTGLVTGYYEPLLQGNRTRTERFRYPLYAPPTDLLTIDLGDEVPELKGRRLRGRLVGQRVVPYLSRADIEADETPLGGDEIAWVDDPIELFFLQIQGSGRLELPDGSFLRVGYADQNGQPFRAIGRVLARQGALPLSRTSMQNIKAWAHAHPQQVQDLLNHNPSYVFFRIQPDDLPGPLGALGVPVTAQGSLAVDPRVIPLGAPVFIDTTQPGTRVPLRRLMVAQDTGGAIHGAVRADFFWGYGPKAGQQAGQMKQAGRMWVLYPRGALPPEPR